MGTCTHVLMPPIFDALLVYAINHLDRRRANQFCKKFLGQETSCEGGRYCYRRKGFLDDIPHRRVVRGVLLLMVHDLDRVGREARRRGAKVWAWRIAPAG